MLHLSIKKWLLLLMISLFSYHQLCMAVMDFSKQFNSPVYQPASLKMLNHHVNEGDSHVNAHSRNPPIDYINHHCEHHLQSEQNINSQSLHQPQQGLSCCHALVFVSVVTDMTLSFIIENTINNQKNYYILKIYTNIIQSIFKPPI